MTTRVLIVDDQSLIRAGFRMLLTAYPDIEVVGEAGAGDAAVRAAREVRPDVILMDLRMPGVDGIEATRRLTRDASRSCRVVILTTFDDDDSVVGALRAGASAFLLKDVDPDALASAIRIVARGDAILAPSVTRHLLDRFAARLTTSQQEPSVRLAGLSARELEILRLLAGGRSNREIAEELTLTETTVKSHVSHLLVKLDARSRTQAVIAAYEAGVVRPGMIASN